MKLLDDTTQVGSDVDDVADDVVNNQQPRSGVDNLAYQAGRVAGKAKSDVQHKIPDKIGKEALGNAAAFAHDTPENRERVKEEAKERIRKYAKDKIKDKLGDEAASKIGKDVGKKAAKEVGKQFGKQVGKQAAKAGVKVGAEVGKNVVRGATALSGPETLGLGWVAGILLEIAIDLSISDAIDCLFELKNGNLKKALYHAQRAYMSVGMFFWLLIAVGMTFSVVGWIIGIPLMVVLTIYMLAGMAFPNIGLFQGLSRWWEKAIIIFVDLIAFIVLMAFIAGLFYWICQQSGLGTGFFATAVTKVVDWWNGNDYASTFNDVCTQLGKF